MSATELPIGVLAGPQLEDAVEDAIKAKQIDQWLKSLITAKVRTVQPIVKREPEFAI